MKKPLLFFSIILLLFNSFDSGAQVIAGRMNEVFLKSDLVNAAANLQDPWEITYGPDDSLWVTEAKGYLVRKISPITGTMRTILDLNTFTDAASTPTTKWRKAYTGSDPNPQGGLMGLAIAPDYMTATNKYVYLAYVHNYVGTNVAAPAPYGAETVNGDLFITWLTRWEYKNGMLQNPIAICDTIRGSSDHNSGRMIIVKDSTGGGYHLFYAVGDMGAGQFANTARVEKAQWTNSYEGKILRFNLDGTIPSTNPFGNAIYAFGVRNNQGFAYDSVNKILYGASHGPFSDDEINIIQHGKNYGHPIVIGYASDNNYQGSKAATPASTLPLISNEPTTAAGLYNYKDPLFSAYPSTQSNINNLYLTNPANSGWPSEGWSGMEFYNNSKIPGWRNALIVAGLKWGRLIKIKTNPAGDAVITTAGQDTASYFGSRNRFRDLAFDPNGRTIYVCMERSTTSSGPSAANPVVPDCLGCIHKYTFIGYNNNAGASTIPTSIPIARGMPNNCKTANSVTIDATNNNIWVPITDDSSNIIAEIKANGNNLGVVTTSFFYKNSGFIREDAAHKIYMDRNITITPTVQPSSNVNVRLYMTAGELARVVGATNSLGAPSGFATINDVAVFKNTNPCGSTMGSSATKFTTTRAAFGSGYVLTVTIPSFSTFYFANNSLTTLPVNLLSFAGSLTATKAVDLAWKTAEEQNLSSYVVERSIDGRTYESIGSVLPTGVGGLYTFSDKDAYSQSALTIYYRLRMVDNDQSYKYSNVITISLADLVGVVVVNPNPTPGRTRVIMTAALDGPAVWKVMDNAGRVVLQNNLQLKSGANSMSLDLSKLAAGLYYLNVSGAGIDSKVKVQKL